MMPVAKKKIVVMVVVLVRKGKKRRLNTHVCGEGEKKGRIISFRVGRYLMYLHLLYGKS